ncbi:MAG TPA: DUF1496 domain-containing protein [Gemmatimonadota bacterium]|nr:DUF1496 domain-containing protein [Gemmatimonadota bacterium]
MQNAHRIVAVTLLLAAACQPPAEEVDETVVVPDTTSQIRQRASANDPFDGCYYQGQRFSMGAVKIQDGVLKKCVEERTWHNVDGFGNLIPEDPSVEDTLSAPVSEPTTETG